MTNTAPPLTLAIAEDYFAKGGTYASLTDCPATVTSAALLVEWWSSIATYLQTIINQEIYDYLQSFGGGESPK